MLIIYEDEFIITVSMRCRRIWTKEEKPRIRRRWGRGREHRVALYVGITVERGELVNHTAGSANGTEFLRWMKKLRERFPEYATIHVILDNVRSHSPGIRPDPARMDRPPPSPPPRVKLVWLPRYTPKLNLAEQVGRSIKRELSYHYLENGAEIEEVLQRYDGTHHPTITKNIAKMCQ